MLVACLVDGLPLVRKYEWLAEGKYRLRCGDFGGPDIVVEDGKAADKKVEYLGVVRLVQFTPNYF